MSINSTRIDCEEDRNEEIEENSFVLQEEEKKNELKCRICGNLYVQPKLILCGHSFCLRCLQTNVEPINDSLKIQCQICDQTTQISHVDQLIDDYLLIHQIEEYHDNQGTLECRACSSNDRAVAHCSTCLDYLCLKCCQAHQYMKCFEQHQVRYLKEDLDKQLSNEKETTNQSNNFNVKQQQQQQQNNKEELRSNFNELCLKIDQQRSTCLSNLDQQLTSLQKHYDKSKEKIDSIYSQYKQMIDEIHNEFISKLTDYQREEEMHLIELLERTQKSSQSFDDFRSICQLYFDKCSFNEIILVQQYLFNRKCQQFEELFQHGFLPNDQQQFFIFETNSIEDFRNLLKNQFGKFVKSSSNQTMVSPTSNIDEHKQEQQEQQEQEQEKRTCLLSSEMINGTESVSSSSTSGVGSLSREGISSSSNGTILSNGQSPSIIAKDDFFFNSNHSTGPVVENLRALESIFTEQISTDIIHPNVQRNLEEILQMNNNNNNNNNNNHYSILTRQISAPPLGQRSPSSSSNLTNFVGSSILTTYSSTTNSGGSSNGNNSRSTTPFSSGTLNCPMDLNYSNASQTNIQRRNGQSMQVRAKFGSLGPQKCQFNAPHGFCLGIDEEIIVADTNNHRIQIFDKLGEFKYQFGIPGKEEGQLWYPRKVAVIRLNGKFVVCDRGNERSRMQIFTRNGHFIKKISIRYIDIVAGLAITQQGNIVAVDSVSPTVFCISECGDLLKWFDCSDYMREPSDIAIFNNEYFVCDFKGHCVAVFDEDGNFLRRIGSESITNFPNGIDISDAGDVIIGDSHGNRFHIAVYSRQGDFLQEFDCPYVKVSRCCGLKITSDGFIVTLAKNNHHVLVLNTLYLS